MNRVDQEQFINRLKVQQKLREARLMHAKKHMKVCKVICYVI